MGQATGRGDVVVAPRSGRSEGPGPVDRGSLADDLVALEALVDRLTAVEVADLDGPAAREVLRVLTRASDRLTALRVRALPPVEADGRWALDGTRTFAHWVALQVGGSLAQARRDVS